MACALRVVSPSAAGPRQAISVLLVAVFLLSTAAEARAEERRTLAGGGHVAYGIGGAFAPRELGRGFRHHLDLAAALGSGTRGYCGGGNSFVGCFDPITGWLFGASALLGFGACPSYVLADAGYGHNGGYGAIGAFLDLGARVAPSRALAIGTRANVDLLLLNVGVRTLTTVERSPEVGLWLTLGIGRY
ncbi:MAG: hypothetical protein JW940_00690 [Polyangiaceae bacterium]|nr:hypothetical protein [Polyangiaceae bacterium]